MSNSGEGKGPEVVIRGDQDWVKNVLGPITRKAALAEKAVEALRGMECHYAYDPECPIEGRPICARCGLLSAWDAAEGRKGV